MSHRPLALLSFRLSKSVPANVPHRFRRFRINLHYVLHNKPHQILCLCVRELLLFLVLIPVRFLQNCRNNGCHTDKPHFRANVQDDRRNGNDNFQARFCFYYPDDRLWNLYGRYELLLCSHHLFPLPALELLYIMILRSEAWLTFSFSFLCSPYWLWQNV